VQGLRLSPIFVGLGLALLLSSSFLASAAEPWSRALTPWSWQFPRDHGAHPEFKTEWWYLTGNLQDTSGNSYGYQLTFFRHGLQPVATQTGSAWAVRDIYFGHLTVTDGKNNRFHFAEKLSRGALGEVAFATNDCSVRIHDWSLRRTKDSAFEMKAWAPEEKFGLELTVQSVKPIAFHGIGGLSQKSAIPGNASHYYSFTRLETKGDLLIGDRRIPVTGLSWLDREFSTSALGQNQEGWDWFCLQFDSGEELMLYRMRNPGDRTDPSSSGTWISESGSTSPLKNADFTIEALGRWKAPGGKVYPSGWKISVPSLQLEGEVKPLVLDQELRLRRIGNLRYWEGACTFRGTRNGKPLTGRGYTELTGYATPIGQGMKE
jgi:predicted secreted hydrolase